MEDKDLKTIELLDNLDKSHPMVAYFQKENIELKHKVVEAAKYTKGDSSRNPSIPTTQEKGKQVINVEEFNVPEQIG